jgi:multidrug efflux pump subunit AcrA (membrane-fusion protein)
MALVQAEADLALELGQQEVARKEWELLRGKKSMSSQEAYLALRKPQLEQARADVAKARLDLQQAELDLERRSVLAPFNCLVLEKNVDLGAQVSTQTTIATLVGTDAYWVETSIPRDRLAWIHVPKGGKGTGSAARIRSASTDNERPGQVIRLLGDIESEGRMARVLVRVDDPLFLKENDPSLVPLLLGEYVHVDIQGRVLDHVVAIPRDALRDGNTIWIATSENTLDIRPADIVWRDAHVAYLGGGVQEGERIIISDIAAPVQNMDIRIADEASGSAGDTSKGSAKNS